MDWLRGTFDEALPAWDDWGDEEPFDLSGYEDDQHDDDWPVTADAPPAIGQDERRMQVRAYNLWADLLGDRKFPDIRALNPARDPDFGSYSVLLDFTAGIENPLVNHIGNKLSEECGAGGSGTINLLSDVPANSLLSRITDHYVQILANQAPIGFEAEFYNRHGRMVVYRGILLPFSSDNRSIDHIYGVLNWKEMADPETSHELLLAVNEDLEKVGSVRPEPIPTGHVAQPIAERLRALTPRGFDAIADDGPEFTLLMARRMTSGNVLLLGEVSSDGAMIEEAARRILAR